MHLKKVFSQGYLLQPSSSSCPLSASLVQAQCPLTPKKIIENDFIVTEVSACDLISKWHYISLETNISFNLQYTSDIRWWYFLPKACPFSLWRFPRCWWLAAADDRSHEESGCKTSTSTLVNFWPLSSLKSKWNFSAMALIRHTNVVISQHHI